jgi:hypothetical protein
MAKLDDIFNAKPQQASPAVKYDYEKEYLRFRFITDFPELDLILRHWVDGQGWVACNKHVYKKRDGSFSLGGECEYCKRVQDLRQQMKDAAIAAGQADISKEDAMKLNKLYKRQTALIAKIEVEVRQGKKIVKPLEAKAILLRANDMVSSMGKGFYKQLQSRFETAETICDKWWTLNKGVLAIDDNVKEEQLNVELAEVDLLFFENQTMDYSEGIKKLQAKDASVAEAEPMEEENGDF